VRKIANARVRLVLKSALTLGSLLEIE